MPERWNALQWDGEPGHYEVYYLTTTDPQTGTGLWIRSTMLAPTGPHPLAPTASVTVIFTMNVPRIV